MSTATLTMGWGKNKNKCMTYGGPPRILIKSNYAIIENQTFSWLADSFPQDLINFIKRPQIKPLARKAIDVKWNWKEKHSFIPYKCRHLSLDESIVLFIFSNVSFASTAVLCWLAIQSRQTCCPSGVIPPRSISDVPTTSCDTNPTNTMTIQISIEHGHGHNVHIEAEFIIESFQSALDYLIYFRYFVSKATSGSSTLPSPLLPHLPWCATRYDTVPT